ncbi:hypothetical protein SHJG_7356 [Streptomyces hygroscopicus subsp. jinggangensis 5008]|nr:hypothetical protein SHJG_7356 [Streptomyces hygroscopicus subsp. jinggangensis 5008]AGF66778.1 hypothetical protein SHJGH_7116 [Streptomyces hygroscopicus subsp. jinggangensis TL01]
MYWFRHDLGVSCARWTKARAGSPRWRGRRPVAAVPGGKRPLCARTGGPAVRGTTVSTSASRGGARRAAGI